MKKQALAFALVLFSLLAPARLPARETLTLASTTSTLDSGLFDALIPPFEKKFACTVKVIAVGSGQAIRLARDGNADVLLVHDRPAEDKFVADGWGIERRDVMYNDFIVVGPKADASKVKETRDAVEGFRRIGAGTTPFISRGDKSGTHAAELRFWKEASVDPKTWAGYKEAGTGMGPTLNMSAAVGGYTLADRGTWLSFKNRQDLEIVLAGDKRLFNPYGVMLVNPEKHPHVKKAAGMKFIEWITSGDGQETIAAYKINGEQLFFPDAAK